MDKKELGKFLVTADTTIKDAVEKLSEKTLKKILFVAGNDAKLLGTVTDGNIRKGTIKGYESNEQVDKLIQKEFFPISPSVKNKKEME